MSIEVKLQVFEGPLDLLLHLIEKNKVNIYDIPIVEITQQYLDYVQQMQQQDMDIMSEFLIMAATLIKIKSKMLLPKEEKEEEEDPREELVKRLIEYKMYKYASFELKDKQFDAEKLLYKRASIPKEVEGFRPKVDVNELIGDLTLQKLNEIFQNVMKRQADKIDPIRSQFRNIKQEEIRVEDKMNEIHEKIRGISHIHFCTLLEKQGAKTEIVVTFLSILELMKMGVIAVRQEEIGGDIWIDSLE